MKKRYQREHGSTDHDRNRGHHTLFKLDTYRVATETVLEVNDLKNDIIGSSLEVLISKDEKYITVNIVLDSKSRRHLSEDDNPKFLKVRTGTYFREFDDGWEADEAEYHPTNVILRFRR